jgi:hypothetical protein
MIRLIAACLLAALPIHQEKTRGTPSRRRFAPLPRGAPGLRRDAASC